MVEDNKSSSVVFPMVLYDGDREIDVGHINIHETLIFKQFQMMLKETVGISYNNLTTYLVEKDVTKVPSERKKILITGKVNFSSLIQEKNCYFLVVLKRSRRDRRRKVGNFYNNNISKSSVFGRPILVAHDQPLLNNVGYDLYNKWNEEGYYSALNEIFSYSGSVDQGRRALCKDCMKAEEEGKKSAFHFCVYDDVVESGFRSPVGPICRPR